LTFLDPAMVAVQKQEADSRLPFVFPEEFYIKYKEQPDGKQKEEEWVLVTKKGMTTPQRTPMRWKDVERTPELLQVLEPYYKSWKSGRAAPITGTALEAWIADAPLIKVLNSVNVRSVEDLAKLEDHLVQKLNIASLREKKKRAIAFLDAQQNTSKVSAEVAALRDKLEDRDRELSELRELIQAHAIKKDQEQSPSPVKRGRGRPRKIVDEGILN
jgi:hypothetical protein